jgi:H+/gluconate symporter-like permease
MDEKELETTETAGEETKETSKDFFTSLRDDVAAAAQKASESLAKEEESSTDDTNSKPKPNLFETFTKLWVSIILLFAVFDLQLSYVLAYLGREQIAETLSVAVVTEIIGVSAVYMIRAHLDTKNEKSNELEVRKFEYETGTDSDEEEEDDTDGVG